MNRYRFFHAGWKVIKVVQAENMPKGELGLYSGMEIGAPDGKIGKLDELMLDPKSWATTHIQMREGHPWDRRT